MSKVEELAKKYCEGSSFEDACMEKPAYIAGYHQAEKDLGLTWNDLALIRLAFDATEDNINHGCLKISKMTKEYYQEILKRFKDLKK